VLKSLNPAKLAAVLAMAAASCVFSLVIAGGWARHDLPGSGNVLFLALGGMVVVGCFVGFAASALANIILRAGPSKLRLPLSAAAWLALCGASYARLVHSGGEPTRSAMLAAIAGICGLVVGVPYAEIVVGSWFLKRILAERDRKLAEINRDHVRRLEEIELQSKARQKAERDARLDEQERPQAIRNYLRS
jgi:apolipoprotein N-acyltransferase